MIVEYHRPKSLEEALRLLAREEIMTAPMGGGTALSQPSDQPLAVVDLQDLGLDRIERRGNTLVIGATAKLQAILDFRDLPPAVGQAVRHEATYNLRQAATIVGTLVASDGRSPLTTALLALDAQVSMLPGDETLSLGDLLPMRGERLRGRMATQVSLPLNARVAYEAVARTPTDLPIVCTAVAQWPSGRTRAALGGWGEAAHLALDGPEAGGAEEAARSASSNAGDAWASAEYRQDLAATLVRRCLANLSAEQPG